MKQKYLLTLVLAAIYFSLSISAQSSATFPDIDELEFVPVSNPDYDWTQFEEKKLKAMLTNNGLELESKQDGTACFSVCELPINMQSDDFIVAMKMVPSKIDDKTPFGVIYDYKNEANYRVLLILKKGFQIIECENGKSLVVKKGLYKGKSKDFTISIMRRKNKLSFGINGMNLTSQLDVNLTRPVFGFIVATKGKLTGKSIACKKMMQKEHEE